MWVDRFSCDCMGSGVKRSIKHCHFSSSVTVTISWERLKVRLFKRATVIAKHIAGDLWLSTKVEAHNIVTRVASMLGSKATCVGFQVRYLPHACCNWSTGTTSDKVCSRCKCEGGMALKGDQSLWLAWGVLPHAAVVTKSANFFCKTSTKKRVSLGPGSSHVWVQILASKQIQMLQFVSFSRSSLLWESLLPV